MRAYTAAFLGGDADRAYGLLSGRCQNEMARNEFASIMAAAREQYGSEAITNYSDDVDGNVAMATYELSDPALNQTQERWVLEDGSWRNDDC